MPEDFASKGQLSPLNVPWSLGNSNPEFKLEYREGDSLVVEVTAITLLTVTPRSFEDRRIELTFVNPQRFGFGRGFDEDNYIELNEYVSGFENFGSDDDATNVILQTWSSTGRCANPYAYEVHESLRLKTLRLDTIGYREFLLITDDPCLEVVARDVSWRFLEAANPGRIA